MEIVINQEKKLAFYTLQRCGTNYIRSLTKQSSSWRWIQRVSHTFKIDEFSIIKTVRDPYSRWHSWFYAFYWEENVHTKWTVKEAQEFLEEFKTTMHYDSHTGLQCILYNIDTSFSKNNIYLKMEDIDIFLGISTTPHVAGTQYQDRVDQMSPSVLEYFANEVPVLYEKDYKWLNEIEIWQKHG